MLHYRPISSTGGGGGLHIVMQNHVSEDGGWKGGVGGGFGGHWPTDPQLD